VSADFFKPEHIKAELTDSFIMALKGYMRHAENMPHKEADLAMLNILNRNPNLLYLPPVGLAWKYLWKTSWSWVKLITKMKETPIQDFIKAHPPSIALRQLPISVHPKARFPVQILSFHITLNKTSN
jgi:hypothetical protein